MHRWRISAKLLNSCDLRWKCPREAHILHKNSFSCCDDAGPVTDDDALASSQQCRPIMSVRQQVADQSYTTPLISSRTRGVLLFRIFQQQLFPSVFSFALSSLTSRYLLSYSVQVITVIKWRRHIVFCHTCCISVLLFKY